MTTAPPLPPQDFLGDIWSPQVNVNTRMLILDPLSPLPSPTKKKNKTFHLSRLDFFMSTASLYYFLLPWFPFYFLLSFPLSLSLPPLSLSLPRFLLFSREQCWENVPNFVLSSCHYKSISEKAKAKRKKKHSDITWGFLFCFFLLPLANIHLLGLQYLLCKFTSWIDIFG